MYTDFNPFFTVTTTKLAYSAQNLSYYISHLTFIMLPLYLAKQTLMSLLRHYCVCV